MYHFFISTDARVFVTAIHGIGNGIMATHSNVMCNGDEPSLAHNACPADFLPTWMAEPKTRASVEIKK